MNIVSRLLEAAVEFVWWGGVQSHFRVQPNYSVEVVLCCRWGCDKKLLEFSLSHAGSANHFVSD